MYPEASILMEVGRIAIAAGRLDAELGAVWWHLGPDQVDELAARKAPAALARNEILKLAATRLDDTNRSVLVAFVEEVAAAQRQRNEVLHSRWLLRGRDAMRPVSDLGELETDEALKEYITDWERQSIGSSDWLQQANDAMQLSETITLDDLIAVERRLSRITDAAVDWQFAIASMRETGRPAGWTGPPEARRSHDHT